jgi:hypothetical protein
VEFSFRSSVETSGGIITLWDPMVVEVEFSVSFEHVLMVGGRMKQEDIVFEVANVYAPCDSSSKQARWVRLGDFLQRHSISVWCVYGDFNPLFKRQNLFAS